MPSILSAHSYTAPVIISINKFGYVCRYSDALHKIKEEPKIRSHFDQLFSKIISDDLVQLKKTKNTIDALVNPSML